MGRLAVVLGSMLALAPPAIGAALCPGDCNDDRFVTVDEVQRLVVMILRPASALCLAGDIDGSGSITVDELVGALSVALSGCPPEEPPETVGPLTESPTATARFDLTPTPPPPTVLATATSTRVVTPGPTSTPTASPTAVSSTAHFQFGRSRKHTDYLSHDSEWTNVHYVNGQDRRWSEAMLERRRRSEYLQVAAANASTLVDGTLFELRGIEVSVTRKCSAARRCVTDAIGLVRPDRWGTIEGNVPPDSDAWAIDDGETVVYGGPNELWGITDWSWADVRSGRLSFVIRAYNNGAARVTASIDAISIRFYWRLPDATHTPVVTGTPTATPTRTPGAAFGTPTLTWSPTPSAVCVGFYNGQTSGSYTISRAETNDADCNSGWYRYPGNPVLERGPTGAWDASAAYHPYATVGDGGTVYLYYVARTRGESPVQGQIGLALSTDGGFAFTKCTVETCGVSNPTIRRCASGTWCGNGFELPVLLYDESDIAERRFKLVVGGHNDVTGVGSIGYFYSANGIEWAEGTKCAGGPNDGNQCISSTDCAPRGTCVNANPLLTVGASTAFDSRYVLPASLVYDPGADDENERWKLFYSGFREQGDRTWEGDLGSLAQGGCATAIQPTGPWTKCVNNPILDRRPNASAELIRDAVPGTNVAHVRKPDVFNVGEPVWIMSRNNGGVFADQYNLISAIDVGAGTLTLARPIREGATVAAGAVVRSLYYAGIYPTAIYYDADSRRWRGFATAFQWFYESFYGGFTRELAVPFEAPTPCPDATPCSSELTNEMSLRGGVLLDPDRAQLFDRHSAENMSLIKKLVIGSR